MAVSRIVTEDEIDGDRLDRTLRPRRGFVDERNDGDRRFTATSGPFRSYLRTVEAEPTGDRWRVRQVVEFELAVPWFGWMFRAAARRHLGRLGHRRRAPWWAPPEALDAHASVALAALAALSILTGYLGTLLTQTITFAADDFGADKSAQGVALASVRFDIVISLVVVSRADRLGRRSVVLFALTAGTALTALGALAPGLPWLAATQILARGFVTAVAILVGIIAAEEMPAGSRAYAISILAMVGALGAGQAVILLPLADLVSWRVLYAVPLLALPLIARVGAHLPESRRFRTPHADVGMRGHGRRFWLLAAAGFLLAMFTSPASQFQNEYLRDERGYSAALISVFTIATNTPGGIGIIVGGRLADVRGRRVVGAVGIVGGVGATVLMYLQSGWALWAWSVTGAIVGAAVVPALGVYGPELFPTSLRGRANGIITGLARLGSVVGLVAAGFLADSFGSLGPALAILAIGPAILALLVLTAFPETAHRELEELNPEDRPPPSPNL